MLDFLKSCPHLCSLAIATHVYFNRYPPSGTGLYFAIPLLILEPLLALSLGSISRATAPESPTHTSIASFALVIVGAYLMFFVSLGLSICAYRLSAFHPLAHVPGPRINKVTKLWDTYVVWTGHRQHRNKELHEQYGWVVRTAPNEISIVDVDALKPVLGELPKGPFYTVRAPNKVGSLLLITGDAHTQRRKRWVRGLNTQALKEYEERLGRRVDQLVCKLGEMSGEEGNGKGVDFGEWMNYIVFDFMGDMAFGGGLEMTKSPNVAEDPFWPMLHRYSIAVATICQVPWIYHLSTKIPFVAKDMLGMVAFGSKIARERVERGTQTKDLWYHLLDEAGLEKEKPSLVDVVRDGALAVLAGADTTSAALCALFYCLLADRNCYNRAQREVDQVSSNGQLVPGAMDANDFPYVSACINEALRLYPSLPTNGPREVPMGSGGKMAAGLFIPEGTQVYMPPYSMLRDPRYFYPDPDAFNPDRWLSTSFPANSRNILNREAYIPFSYGYANCVGKQLALQELLSITVTLLARFHMRFEDGWAWETWPESILDYLITTRPEMRVAMEVRMA